MKTLNIAGVVLASLSVSCGQVVSWESSEAADVYVRDLDEQDFDIRDLENEFETNLFERELFDEVDEPQLHVRNQESRNNAIISDIAKTRKEMAAALTELGPWIVEAEKKFPVTKDTGKAWQELGGKKKKKSKSQNKSQDEKDDELMSDESFWTKRNLMDDATRDNKAESIIRCGILLNSFMPKGQLAAQLSYAEKHLKWNQWQYMEWELLTLQAVQMSKLMGTCGSSGIQDPNTRLGNVWMAFSNVVSGLAAGARQNLNFPDKKMQQLAREFAGYQSS